MTVRKCKTCGMPFVGTSSAMRIEQAIYHTITTDGDHIVHDNDLLRMYDKAVGNQ